MKFTRPLIEVFTFGCLVASVGASQGGLRMIKNLAPSNNVESLTSSTSFSVPEVPVKFALKVIPNHETGAASDGRFLQQQCPSIGDGACSPNSDCVCGPETPQNSGVGTDGEICWFCVVADGQPCEGDFQCKPDVSRCVDGQCFSREERPLICPDFVLGTFDCETDESCVCQDPTPNLSTNSNGCRVCHAKADDEGCTGSEECSPNSYCDLATATCVTDSVCPTTGADGRFSCVTDSTCNCDDSSLTKTETPLSSDPNTLCYVCTVPEEPTPPPTCPANGSGSCETDAACECGAATPNKAQTASADGESCYVCHAKTDDEGCSEQSECSPDSYCDLATDVCLANSVCPTISADGAFSCNTDPSCDCDDATAAKSPIPNFSGATCYVCTPADGSACTSTSDCSPNSYCDIATGSCLANSVCPTPNSEGSFSCNPNDMCECASGTKSSIESTTEPGTFCNVCTEAGDGDTCSDQTQCPPTSYCDFTTNACVDNSICPTISSEGEFTCITDDICECADGTWTKSAVDGDEPGVSCFVCTPPDGQACSDSTECAPASYCDAATGTCLPDSVCPTIPSSGPYTCNTDSTCECAAGTGTKSAVPLSSQPGSFCHVCAGADGDSCSVDTDCSPNSYCDFATKTCLADDVCPTISSSGEYTCNIEPCECAAGTGTKSSVESSRPGVFCQVCTTEDGGDCSAATDCAPGSYCDLGNTNTCIPDSVCPEMSSEGSYTCNPDQSCSCDGEKDSRVAVERRSSPGTFCNVCFIADNDSSKTCSGFTDCAPSSRCEKVTGTCVSDSICLFTENGTCTLDPECSCPAGRSQKEHTLQGGVGKCYTCEAQ